jgi:hypothetical protein
MPPFLPEPDIRTTIRRDIIARKEVNQSPQYYIINTGKYQKIISTPTTEHEDG